ncbi:phosphopantetheine-binding protein [Bacillus mycoides]|uniref:Acyl carrier protein n=1 Tax=Bacillus mycoides TaxID=1405 RepID=A0A1S9T1U2_BACMY|nr:phosphopantetheine-binding protein [Bacillus mycoides]OOR03659.1 acyl carrier protein [Bacillus mycoides]
MDKVFIKIINTYLQEELCFDTKDTDLKELGLDSLASIELLLELEEMYDITFPDELLTEDTFSSGSNLWGVLNNLKENSEAS